MDSQRQPGQVAQRLGASLLALVELGEARTAPSRLAERAQQRIP